MTDDKITVFLADDHQIVVDGIISLVSHDPDIQVIGTCNNGMEVPDAVEAAHPDVLVQDISMPGLNGLDVCRIVKSRLPDVAVLMLTMHCNEQCVLDALQNGAAGFLIKDSASGEFCDAIHAAARDELYLGQGVSHNVLARLNRDEEADPYEMLSERERHVFQMRAEGMSNQQIGEQLGIPLDDVVADYGSLAEKMGLANHTDLVKCAIRKRLILVD